MPRFFYRGLWADDIVFVPGLRACVYFIFACWTTFTGGSLIVGGVYAGILVLGFPAGFPAGFPCFGRLSFWGTLENWSSS